MARFLFSRGQHTEESQHWPESPDQLWVDLGPGDDGDVKGVLHRFYDAHPKVIEHALEHRRSRPSLLIEDDAVSFSLSLIPTEVPAEQLNHLHFVVGRNFLVTVHLKDVSDVVDQAMAKVKQDQMMHEGADFALYHVMVSHITALQRLASQLTERFEGMQQEMLEHVFRDMSPQILVMRKRAMGAKHILDPERSIVNLLQNSDFAFVQKKNRPYFQDAAFLMQEVVNSVETVRDGLAAMDQGYTALQSNQINKVMWFLTVVATLSLPATMLASIYGMNWKYMPELSWHWGYYFILVLMGFLSVVMLLWLRIHRRQD